MRKSGKTKKLKLTGRQQIEAMEGLTADAAGWLTGRTSRMLRSWIGAPRNGTTWNGRDLVEWLVARAKGEAKAAASEGLERERAARGRLKELEVGKAEGSLLSRAEVHVAMVTLGVILRGVGERLLCECGEGAAAILDEGMEVFGREVVRAFGEESGVRSQESELKAGKGRKVRARAGGAAGPRRAGVKKKAAARRRG